MKCSIIYLMNELKTFKKIFQKTFQKSFRKPFTLLANHDIINISGETK